MIDKQKSNFGHFSVQGYHAFKTGKQNLVGSFFYDIMTANLPNPQKSQLHRRLAHRINAAAASIKKARCMIL